MSSKKSFVKTVVFLKHAPVYLLLLLLLVLNCCVATLPITQGPVNLDKGGKDLYAAGLLQLAYYDYLDNNSDYHEFYNLTVGFNYGMSKFINVGTLFWLGMVSEIGLGPQFSFQLLQGRYNLNLCLKGGIAKSIIYDTDYSISITANPELILGLGNRFFIGLRYNYRWYKPYLKNLSEVWYDPFKDNTKLIGLFFGRDYSDRFRLRPFFILNCEPDENKWQFTGGISYHFLSRNKRK